LITSTKESVNVPDFTRSDTRISELLDHAHEISDLAAIVALAEWDLNTAIPEGAAEIRGSQMATLQGLLHERQVDPKLGHLVDELGETLTRGEKPFTDTDRALVREAKRAYDHATKLPRKLVEEITRVQASSFDAWRRAKEQSDFSLFAPWLSRTAALQREIADRFGYTENRYDALLDQYEPGMTVSKLDQLFAPVREVSKSLLRRIEESSHTIDTSCLQGDFSPEKQVALSKTLLQGMGYDFAQGGIAQSPHPFTTSFGSPFDVRLTIHPDRHFIQAALMAAIHEGGHALYEQGSALILARTPLAGGASMGVHESQSRLWENAIGRSEAYWNSQFAAVRATFPEQYRGIEPATFARALNKVQPSLIRVEADEVTYNLHIIIRYELEKQILNGDITIESLPSLWNAKYKEYLGIEPANDAAGVLQDIHWTSGFGYFPTYTLGNLYGAQIYSTLRKAFPNFDERLASGDTLFILNWLQEKMYAFGAIYQPEELIRRVTGETPNPEHFVRYLTSKFEKVYGLGESGR
jgi:carboxypeptidase Taq